MEPVKASRYVVKVKPQSLAIVPRTAFDPPADVFFETRDRAQGWCDALNRCLGYERFVVAEAQASSSELNDNPEKKRERSSKRGGVSASRQFMIRQDVCSVTGTAQPGNGIS